MIRNDALLDHLDRIRADLDVIEHNLASPMVTFRQNAEKDAPYAILMVTRLLAAIDAIDRITPSDPQEAPSHLDWDEAWHYAEGWNAALAKVESALAETLLGDAR